MKTKLLVLAFPVLCLACRSTEEAGNGAPGTDSPYLAKSVVGVRMLSNDVEYQKPCDMVGEEYIQHAFGVAHGTEMAEIDQPNGCEFEWGGNKVMLTFGGKKPYETIYLAEHLFDKQYQGAAAEAPEVSEEPALSGPEPEGTAAETPATESATSEQDSAAAAPMPIAKPAVSKSAFVAMPGLGDKAVWDPAKNTLHILYNNHIVNITVETKDKPEVRKERAHMIGEVMIEKIVGDEYIK